MEQSELILLRNLSFKRVNEGDLSWNEREFYHKFIHKGEVVIENEIIFVNCKEPDGDGETFTIHKCKFTTENLHEIFKWLKIPY